MTLIDLQELFRSLEQDYSRFERCNEAMFKLLVMTALRHSELVSLILSQLDLNNQTILIHGKSKKERLLPLQPSLIPLLLTYKEMDYNGELLLQFDSYRTAYIQCIQNCGVL